MNKTRKCPYSAKTGPSYVIVPDKVQKRCTGFLAPPRAFSGFGTLLATRARVPLYGMKATLGQHVRGMCEIGVALSFKLPTVGNRRCNAMGTIKHTLSAINAMRYVCARWISETGEYRVCPRFDHLSGSKRNERREACAYYTDDAADAFDTAAHFNSRLEADINAYD